MPILPAVAGDNIFSLLSKQNALLGGQGALLYDNEFTLLAKNNGLIAAGTGVGGGGGTTTYGNFGAMAGNPPAANNAAFNTLNSIPVLDFAQGVVSGTFFVGIMPQGAALSATLSVLINWLSSVTTGTVVWGAAFENSMTAGLDTDHFGTQTTGTTTVSGTPNKLNQTIIALPNNTLGAIAAEQTYRLQIQRLASGTLAGVAKLVSVELRS